MVRAIVNASTATQPRPLAPPKNPMLPQPQRLSPGVYSIPKAPMGGANASQPLGGMGAPQRVSPGVYQGTGGTTYRPQGGVLPPVAKPRPLASPTAGTFTGGGSPVPPNTGPAPGTAGASQGTSTGGADNYQALMDSLKSVMSTAGTDQTQAWKDIGTRLNALGSSNPGVLPTSTQAQTQQMQTGGGEPPPTAPPEAQPVTGAVNPNPAPAPTTPTIPKGESVPTQPAIPRRETPQQETARLQASLAGGLDPAQRARITARLGAIAKQGAATQNAAAKTPAVTGAKGKASPQQTEANKLQAKIDAGGLDPAQVAHIQTRISYLQKNYGITKPKATGGGEPVPTDTTGATDTTTPTPEVPGPTTETPAEPLKTLEDFLPKDNTKSQLYQNQIDAGKKRLDYLMASRGLTGSGAENQANIDMVNQATGDENERAKAIAQINFDNYNQTRRDASNLQTTKSEDQWKKTYDILSLIMSQNPQAANASVTNNAANQVIDQGKYEGAVRKDKYGRVIAKGGGGARGGGGAAVIPPPPPQATPNSYLGSLLNAGSGGQSGNALTGILGNLLGNLLK